MNIRTLILVIALVGVGSPLRADEGTHAPPPTLSYAFSVRATLAPPVEQGEVDQGRKRFIAITGGTVSGPKLAGEVLPGGGDWQVILPGGLTSIEARYFLKVADGTVIEVTNPGVRTAAPEVIEKLAKGENVDPSAYYFRTTPRFSVKAGPHEWLRRQVFVARGIRKPDSVVIDFYSVE
ncbi:uncharacterized protein DUF3237 [Novosphingobium taihuense]|nr:uncharacterized protein DUF3237 [Novosphingobium taihuense]